MKLRKLIRILLGFVLLPVVVAACFVKLEAAGFFNLDQIELIVDQAPPSGGHYLQEWIQELDQELEVFRGQSLWKIDLPKLSESISKQRWIETFTLSRRFPSQLRVTIALKPVPAILMSKAGKFFPVIDDGSLLNSIDSRFVPDLPILIGEAMEKSQEIRKKSTTVLREVPSVGAFSQKAISEIRYDNKEGFWMTLVKSGISVKMGEDQIALKSDRVTQVIDYMSAHSFEARVIDANLSKKVLVRLRKDP